MVSLTFLFNQIHIFEYFSFRFIQPLKKTKSSKNEGSQKSSFFMDKIVPTDRNYCGHTDSCDSHIYKVLHFYLIPSVTIMAYFSTGYRKLCELCICIGIC